MDKRDDKVSVRVPHELKRRIKKHAAKHGRSISMDILRLIDYALHVEEYKPGAWSEDAAEADER